MGAAFAPLLPAITGWQGYVEGGVEMLVIAALFLGVLGASVFGLRTAGGRPRWPFLVASTISGSSLLALVMAMVIASSVGRNSWNSWVSGTPLSETVTLWVVLIVGPILLATSCALLLIGTVLPTRQRHRSEQDTLTASR
jgi:hypothetical protein